MPSDIDFFVNGKNSHVFKEEVQVEALAEMLNDRTDIEKYKMV